MNYLKLPTRVSNFERGYLARINKIALIFFWCHVPVLMGVAALAQTGVWSALILSGLVLAGPTLAHKAFADRPRLVSVTFGVTSMCMGALLVHFGQGPVQIEMHFYFFVLIALLAVMANPMAILAAAVTVAVHHALFYFLWPASVFNYDAQLWVVGVHALFVVLESAGAIFVARSFFDSVVGLDEIVQERTAALDARNHDMRTVLDHVGEGLLTVDREGRIGNERSSKLSSWFPEPPTNQCFETWMAGVDPDYAAWFSIAFEELLADVMPREVTLEQLPKRLHVAQCTLECSYVPIDHGGQLVRLLVSMRDITEQLERARAEAERRDAGAAIEALVKDRSGFADFFDESCDIVASLAEQSEKDKAIEARRLHTLKGNAGLYGMFTLASLCHDIESRASEGGGISIDDRLALADVWQRLATGLRPLLGADSKSVVRVQRPEYEKVLGEIRREQPGAEIVRLVERWGLDPVQPRLERLAEHAKQLAKRLGKLVEVRVEANDTRVHGDAWAGFWAAMIHLSRNAVDHGVEVPDTRTAAGKSEIGQLTLRARVSEGEFVVEMSDDGCGVQWERVRERAKQKGLPHQSQDDLLRALFSDGFSTREEVTAVSGRGVGLGALRQEVEARGGRVEVSSSPGRGTTWSLVFPQTAMRQSTAAHRGDGAYVYR
jgi:two-component system chemotaxis sensor kinase CheA